LTGWVFIGRRLGNADLELLLISHTNMNILKFRPHLSDKGWFTRAMNYYFDCFFPAGATVCVEISADCNLKCVMCPRGGVHGLVNKRRGMMDIEIFKKIIDKFRDENVRVRELWLANWGEPFLNPLFPEMARYAKSRLTGAKIIAFSNLNCLMDPSAVMSSGLDRLEVSMSGMSQEVYSKNHVGGDIKTVLRNIAGLVSAKKRLRGAMAIAVKFHDYVYNKAEAVLAKDFCRRSGIEFKLARCSVSCVEGNAAFQKEKERFSGFYSRFIDLKKEEKIARTLKTPADCMIKCYMVTIDFDGRLYRCCGVYEEKNLMGSFFDHAIREIPGINSSICDICVKTPISWR